MVAAPRPSRRTVLAGAGALLASACTSAPRSEPARTRTRSTTSGPTTAGSPASGPIRWANWPEYIDVDEGRPSVRPTLAAFSKQTGIDVTYREVIEDNARFVASIDDKLSAGADVGYDLVVLTSWMSARLVGAEQVQPLRRDLAPAAGNLIAALAEPGWDPGRRFSMPWQAGLTGIAYDARRVRRPVSTIRELLTRSDLRGGVGLLTEFADAAGFALLDSGADPSNFTIDEAELALDRLAAVRRSGHLRGFYGNEYVDELRRRRLVACSAWSGDILQLQAEDPNIKFVIPDEGLMIWSDDMLVPKASQRGAEVARLIDYYYRPTVAARLAAWVNYICPVEGARAAMERLDPDLAESPLIFPDDTILERSYQFMALEPADDARLRERFAELAG